MNSARRLLYESQNGDRWFLVSHAPTEIMVRHEPNLSSGGRSSEIAVHSFIAQGRGGPEHVELMRLIGTLVPDDDHTSSLA